MIFLAKNKNKDKCDICGKNNAELIERGYKTYCKECNEREQQIAKESYMLNLEQKKLLLKGKQRELKYRVLAQLVLISDIYFDRFKEEISKELDGKTEIPLLRELEPDILLTSNTAIKLAEEIPAWKLLNLKDKLEFEIKQLEFEIKEMEKNI